MKRMIITALAALSVVFAGAALAQEAKPADAAKDATKDGKRAAYHAGGKHDQKQHEAAIRAKEANGPMKAPAQHAGGKHDQKQHERAIRAEAEAAKK